MKEIKRFENGERLVRMVYCDSDKTYSVSVFSFCGKVVSRVYKSLFYAEKKFNDYKNYPIGEVC